LFTHPRYPLNLESAAAARASIIGGRVTKRRVILATFHVCKALGLFRLARRLTRSDLRILCYHGFVLDDEDRFRDSLFVSRAFLDRRMRYLRDLGYRVLPLDEAVDRLSAGTLPRDPVTITIDDGFHSVHAVAREVLGKYRFPSTLYLTSYYFEKATPIFQLAVDYMCWKSPRETADMSGLGIPALGDATALTLTPEKRAWASREIFAHGADALDENGRVALSQRLAECLDVDYGHICDSRMLSLVSPDEARRLEESGMAIEMHTHRHRFPDNPGAALAELQDNRTVVEPVIGRRMTHFCYPSGKWSHTHRPVLEKEAIKSATTCHAGLARKGANMLALPRILDDNRVSQIEFEAEVSGFTDLLRRARGKSQTPFLSPPSFVEWVGAAPEMLVFA
jgi:peptidoglycan/xylan/chitin deacetylase (PgdA/CDA1 family)